MRMLVSCGVALALVGCGASTGSSGGSTSDGAEVPSPPRAWDQMSEDEHRAWMVNEVVPRMSVAFQTHDGERYANFGCATCHGRNARETGFAMPNAALPALYPTGSPEQRQMVREYEDACRFMFTRVVPTMQTLLGASDFDASTQQGFSCYACHPHAGEPSTTPIRLGAVEAPSEPDAQP